jgi:hypothetical protein
MGRSAWVPAALVAVLFLSFLPSAGASTGSTGSATSCAGTSYCHFTLSSSKGTGWAQTYGTSIDFLLPGEANTTFSTTYSAAIVRSVTNGSSALDWVSGSFTAVDANSGKVVFGSTNTNITDTTHCSHTGCGHTYSVHNGTIRFVPTNLDGTRTTISCGPSSFNAGGSTHCTATVTDLANRSLHPTGNVSWAISSYYYGSFSSHARCSLVGGNCTIKFHDADDGAGTIPMYASFHGPHPYYASAGETYLYVSGGG